MSHPTLWLFDQNILFCRLWLCNTRAILRWPVLGSCENLLTLPFDYANECRLKKILFILYCNCFRLIKYCHWRLNRVRSSRITFATSFCFLLSWLFEYLVDTKSKWMRARETRYFFPLFILLFTRLIRCSLPIKLLFTAIVPKIHCSYCVHKTGDHVSVRAHLFRQALWSNR